MAAEKPDSEVETTKSEKIEVVDSEAVTEAAQTSPTSDKPKSSSKLKTLWQKALANKKWSIPAAVVLLVALLLALPFSRYPILGTFMSQDFQVSVTDLTTGKPVSSAEVNLAGKTVKTNADGKASLKVKVGNSQITIQKKYYKDFSKKVLVPIGKSNTQKQFKVEATGRQVPITVKNVITGAGVAGVTIKAADTDATTDKDGKVTLVVPADKTSVETNISKSGYNDSKVNLTVTEKEVDANKFKLTPTGKIYFLSKLSGKIDVVKTNLDGSNRATVLAGTGKEEDGGTVMLASRDWKYLALLSKRDSSLPKLYLIETGSDKLTTIDEGNASFELTGWVGQNFVYLVKRNAVQVWQPKATALKTFNAASKKLTIVDETRAEGDDKNYSAENISWVNAISNKIVYYKTWEGFDNLTSFYAPKITGKQSEVISSDLNGTKTTVKSFNLGTAPNTSYFNPLSSYNAVVYEPNEIFFSLYNDQGGVTYDKYEDGQITENDKDSIDYFSTNKAYPTYLESPSGNQAFWSEERDGKQTLFVGDENGGNGKQIASLSELTQYGWYTDDYLLVSKKGSELYILGKNGGTPFKVTDYHKPSQNFYGYGGGYGGI